MALDVRIETALQASDQVSELRRLAQRWLEEGMKLEEALRRFETARHDLRQAQREADEDSVLDVMDMLTGWCAPAMKLGDRKGA